MTRPARLRMGVMACADIAQRAAIPAMLDCEDIQLVAVASRSAEKAKTFAAKFGCEAITGYENLLQQPDIDAIYIPLPTGLHEEWVSRCLEAGKHALVEKSFAMDHASAQKLTGLARARGLLVMENFMFLHHSQLDFVRRVLEEGEIGELRSIRSSFGFPPLDQNNFRYNRVLGGGALLDAGAYTIRASQLFLGDAPLVRAASLFMPEGADVDIYGGAYLSSDDGIFAEVSFGFDNFYQCNFELWGSKGKLIAHRAFTAGADVRPVVTLEKQGECIDHKLNTDRQFVKILSAFAKRVSSGNLETSYREIEAQSRLLDQVRLRATA